MDFITNVNVGLLTTFGISADAGLFVEIHSIEELKDLGLFLKEYDQPFFIMGGGSNTVFIRDFDGLVVKLNFSGWEIVSESKTEVIVKVLAGTDWHNFVMWCVENEFGGLENLALIPGNVGTAPVQNIGAYGVEVKDTIRLVDFFDFETLGFRKLLNEDCDFGYRDSIFKNQLVGKGIITSVEFRLAKKGFHKLNLSYKPVEEALKSMIEPKISDVFQAVVDIRKSKLPDWKVLGTAGSFFKNPIVDSKCVERLRSVYPDMPIYDFQDKYKLAAGWLIDQSGLKGASVGGVSVYEKQALVLVNSTGTASGMDLVEMKDLIVKTVQDKFGVMLETEVNLIG